MNTLQRAFYAGIGTAATFRGAFAAIDPGLEKITEDVKGTDGGDWLETLQSFIIYLLGFLGFIVVLMALYGGWQILTSGSEDEGKEAGKKIIINAAIGVVVIFFAYTITQMIFSILTKDSVGG
jgi:hypothetical protein